MNTHEPTPREALQALTLFLTECSLDRGPRSLPLRNILDSEEVEDFHLSLEDLMRGLLVEYSLEQRMRLIKDGLRRTMQKQLLH